ncbi:MAG: class I SAM-dependent methyltransferase [Myxococcales bacterium]|nr:class I SAM-dependent methyltransferase [Myxococcales bacterium]
MHPIDVRNLQFYETVGDSFSQTRNFPWQGWHTIVWPSQPILSVLDIGCGNGRLYPFLAKRYAKLSYTGVDFSPTLLAYAAKNIQTYGRPQDETTLIQQDIHDLPESLSSFDCICAFGVLHHVAQRSRRHQLITSLAYRLCSRGQLWVTLWQFAHDPRFARHTVSLPDEEAVSTTIEPGGRWLNFSGVGHRYCVDITPEEITQSAAMSDLRLLNRFYADGKSARLNIYLGFTP